MNFHPNLTDEELMLQSKYQILRLQKQKLQSYKAPKQEVVIPRVLKQPHSAFDATELARKLVKSGAIQVNQREQSKCEQTSFKRPKGQRKCVDLNNNVVKYQPFSKNPPNIPPSIDDSPAARVKHIQNLYQQYVRFSRAEAIEGRNKTPRFDASIVKLGQVQPAASSTIDASANGIWSTPEEETLSVKDTRTLLVYDDLESLFK